MKIIIGKVKIPNYWLESVSVRIGKGWIGLKDFPQISKIIKFYQYIAHLTLLAKNNLSQSQWY